VFVDPPLILAHEVSCNFGGFVVPDKIIVKENDNYSLKARVCPHRGYVMHNIGDTIVNQIHCKLHGFCWNKNGEPSSNEHFYKLPHYGSITKGKSGLLFQNFNEPIDADWVHVLSKEKNLQYTKSYSGKSNGSWLWLMDLNADLLHFRANGIHPRQSLETPLETLSINNGDGWCIQTNETGFWLFIFPFTAIEYEPGKLSVNRVVPNDINDEYGFTWHTQLYYDPIIDSNERNIWEKLIDVYLEDIEAIENIKPPFYPLKRKTSNFENHVLQWADWYNANLSQKQ